MNNLKQALKKCVLKVTPEGHVYTIDATHRRDKIYTTTGAILWYAVDGKIEPVKALAMVAIIINTHTQARKKEMSLASLIEDNAREEDTPNKYAPTIYDSDKYYVATVCRITNHDVINRFCDNLANLHIHNKDSVNKRYTCFTDYRIYGLDFTAYVYIRIIGSGKGKEYDVVVHITGNLESAIKFIRHYDIVSTLKTHQHTNSYLEWINLLRIMRQYIANPEASHDVSQFLSSLMSLMTFFGMVGKKRVSLNGATYHTDKYNVVKYNGKRVKIEKTERDIFTEWLEHCEDSDTRKAIRSKIHSL